MGFGSGPQSTAELAGRGTEIDQEIDQGTLVTPTRVRLLCGCANNLPRLLEQEGLCGTPGSGYPLGTPSYQHGMNKGR